MPENEKTICPVCELPGKDCICCGCEHICPRDRGEPYCPVCLPEPGPPAPENDTDGNIRNQHK